MTMQDDRLRRYIDSIFEDAPQTKKTVELKEEMLQNLQDKYSDLIAEGKSEEAAFNIAVAGVGDITGLLNDLNAAAYQQQATTAPVYTTEKDRRRSAALVTVAVVLYILAVIPLFILQNEYGLIALLCIAAIATGILVFNNMTNPKKAAEQDYTVVEEFRHWQNETSRKAQSFKAIKSALWSIVTVLYFIISFTQTFSGNPFIWAYSWVIFLIGGAIESVIRAFYDLSE